MRGDTLRVRSSRVGPPLIFERLWEETGIGPVMRSAVTGRACLFPLERAVFLTVLHRLMNSGSDRVANKRHSDYQVDGVDALDLHHLYRAMEWLGEELPEEQQADRQPFAPRCTKDVIEETLFARRRDLFTSLSLVFFDATSICFEGRGGETVGNHGKSKGHPPDLKHMVVGLVLDGQGQPVFCQMCPGNTADVATLVPIADRLRRRFGIVRVCIVADRGMISEKTIVALESEPRQWLYILGARMRAQKEVRDDVLGAPRRSLPRGTSSREDGKDPSPLDVKEVRIGERRYIVCFNEEQARKDRADRKAIVVALRNRLRQGDESFVGNQGYRKFLKSEGPGFRVDPDKVHQEAHHDGKWVLRTNTDWDMAEVALQYKRLWMVEEMFRSARSPLPTRPLFHKRDDTIRGHVFCSFLALVLRSELQYRLEAKGYRDLEWADIIRDLDALTVTDVEHGGKRVLLRNEATGTCGKVFQAVGVALPPTLQSASTSQT
ncbi:MAG TPA: transposase [Anaeromyxobacteraceae bacterium]|nr:transposase [Anaeromyxobacteraceae bacterium]